MIKPSGDKRYIFDFVMISAPLPLKRDIHYRGHFEFGARFLLKGFVSGFTSFCLPILPPRWNFSPSQGCPRTFHQVSLAISWYPFILLGGERRCLSNVFFPRTQHMTRPGLGPNPRDAKSSALTSRPPRLQLIPN